MSMQVSDYISQLLFDHECVVVPGFGAFLTRYYSAEVNAATHMLRPPGKRVYFNASIRENDGLLAKTVSLDHGISYDLALNRIKSETQSWQNCLAEGKKLTLPGIGKLYTDELSGKLQFSPSLENNYLPEAYGLSIFRSPAVKREEQIKKDLQKSIEKHLTHTGKRKSRALPWAAVLGPLIFAGALGASYFIFPENSHYERADFNWFKSEKVISSEEAPAEIEKEETAVFEKVAEEPATPPAPVEELTSAEESIGNISIVVGAFKEKANADKLVSSLSSEGFKAYTSASQNGFNRVAIGSFNNREEALMRLDEIRKQVNPGAWIYVK